MKGETRRSSKIKSEANFGERKRKSERESREWKKKCCVVKCEEGEEGGGGVKRTLS